MKIITRTCSTKVLFLPVLAVFTTLILGATVALADDPPAYSLEVRKLVNASQGKAMIRVDRTTGYARFVRLPPHSMPSSRITNSFASPNERSMAFFRTYGDAFGVIDAHSQLRAVRTVSDATGAKHAIFSQLHQNIPVFGGELRTHFDPRGELIAVNGNFVAGIKVDLTPRLSPDAAVRVAIDRVQHGNPATAHAEAAPRRPGHRERVQIEGSRSTDLSAVFNKLMVFRAGMVKGVRGKDHLAYEVEVRNQAITIREFVYVDAHNGTVIDQITGIHDAKFRRAFDAMDMTAPGPNYPGSPFWVEGDAFPTGTVEADNMILGSGETYDLFMNAFGRDSFDDGGATMDAIFNRGDFCPNASWNGTFISFCPGLTTDDVTAHEWGHAYTQFTNNLIYQWQSGALNESYSDIWGEIVDLINGRMTDAPGDLRTDGACAVHTGGTDNSLRWLMGEDVNATGLVGAIRDMWTPNCYGDPGKVTDTQYHCAASDNGGVHINSGIPNHAFALMVDGGNYNGYTGSGLGLTKAAHIHFAAQIMLTPTSNFVDHADALDAACTSLTGVDLLDLSTGAPSGQMISAADCTEVSDISTAVEFRTAPEQCGFEPLLDPDAPLLCEAQGTIDTIALEDFEGGAIPAGWTASTHDVANLGTFDTLDWDVVSSLPAGASGSFAAFVADLVSGDCAADDETGALSLDSPAMVLPDGRVPRVAFDHWVATEAGWDGGNLKVSVNGGDYVSVPAEHYSFNPYNATLNSATAGNTNPLQGEDAFTGTDEGTFGGSWGQSQVNLYGLALPGDTIQIRFDFGVDACNGAIGWYVDEVHTYSCSAEPLPICGDGQRDVGEMCDDGNMNDGDGCSASCAVESGWMCSDGKPFTTNDNMVADWSFEDGVPNTYWTPSSTFDGIPEFPLCGPGNFCPAAGLATTGVWNVWIGGLATGVTSSVEQAVVIPATATDMTVQVLRGICDDPSDTLHVSIDGNDIGTVVCDAIDGNFVEKTFSVAGYNDDGLHTLFIGGTVGGTNGTHSNFFVDDVFLGDNTGSPAEPSMCQRVIEELSCNAGTVGFDDGIADAWTVVDNAGGGLVWRNITGSGELGNYTGADGDAASVSSDWWGPADFDTELRSNVFSLAHVNSASLEYLANYQNFLGADFLDLDISVDGGATWTNLMSWNESHGGFRTPPGEAHSINLNDYRRIKLNRYKRNSEVQLRWRYYDPTTNDWDWYAQIDDVALTCDLKGKMSGKGEVINDAGKRFDHHFSLQCRDGGRFKYLKVDWRAGGEDKKFRLTDLDEAICSDSPGIDEGSPNAGFDTFVGSGIGTLNGQEASITFRFTDAGEPGVADEAEYTITGPDGVTVSGVLEEGNHNARKRSRRR